MDCRLTREGIPLFMNNRLSREKYYQVLIHIAQCRGCRDELIWAEQIKKGIEKGFAQIEQPPGIKIPVQGSPQYWRKEVEDLVEGLIYQMFAFSKLR